MLVDYIRENYPDLLLADGHDNAIIGVGGAFDQAAVIYDAAVVIKNLIEDGLSPLDAEEYYYYNIAGAFVGKHTPIFVHDKGR